MKRKAVFLDRDGVINAAVVRDGKPYPPANVDVMEILPGVPDALQQLRDAGYVLVVVTNQPDVARGKTPRATIDAIHDKLRAELPLDAIYACFHDDAEHCGCRKPAPGMLLQAAEAMQLDLSQSFMVGDRWRDTDAGIAAGCSAVFINRNYQERKPTAFDIEVSDLVEAAGYILAKGQR